MCKQIKRIKMKNIINKLKTSKNTNRPKEK